MIKIHRFFLSLTSITTKTQVTIVVTMVTYIHFVHTTLRVPIHYFMIYGFKLYLIFYCLIRGFILENLDSLFGVLIHLLVNVNVSIVFY